MLNYSLTDKSAETAVLGGIYQHGPTAYYDIADLLHEKLFTINEYSDIYLCLKHIIENYKTERIDASIIHTAAQELGKDYLFERKTNIVLINTLRQIDIDRQNLRPLTLKLIKLSYARTLCTKLDTAKQQILQSTGSEPLNQIIGIAEKEILDFTLSINDHRNIINLGTEIQDYVEYLKNNPVDQIGIPTGFPIWDKAIGGGLRPSTVNIIGARIKQGKSIIGQNIGLNIAKNNIPVLNLDTEMTKQDHFARLLAQQNEINITDIETGKFAKDPYHMQKVQDSLLLFKNLPYYYESINSKNFEEQLALMRRWVVQHVGLLPNGTAKPCVIVYDWIRLSALDNISNNVAEHQMLGFILTGLQEFANKYQLPIVAMMQLNRDGINLETSAAASQSDRIVWFCSNFTILKPKSNEELEEDGTENGNKKLVVVLCRHGPGLEHNEYINLHAKLWCAKIIEGRSNFEDNQNSQEPEVAF